jgi:hypothetical protein
MAARMSRMVGMVSLNREMLGENFYRNEAPLGNVGSQARRFWVENVPFFIISGKITMSGTQRPTCCLMRS